MKKIVTAIVMAAMMAGAFAQGGSETGSSAGSSSSPRRLTFGTGSAGGNFYVVGGGIANVINNKLGDKYNVTAEETGGSTADLTGVENGEMDFGIAMTSSFASGLDGSAKWTQGKPMQNVRGMIPLYPSYLTIYTLASSDIHTLKDFKGHIVGLGSKGAAMDNMWRQILPALDAEPASIFNDGHGATATAVGQGQVDAALLYSLPPFAAIAQLEASHDVRFIGLTPEEQAYVHEKFPYDTPAVMPKGSYKGVTEDIPTMTEWNMMFCSASLPDDVVYEITKMLFENNQDLVTVYKGLSYATPENTQYFNIPLHPGVIKYLEEIGIEVPDSQRPKN